jgi:hypothetical protein
MMAGRCFSANQLALSSARVSITGFMMGQAAGITPPICIEDRCDLRDVDPNDFQRIIVDRGGELDV